MSKLSDENSLVAKLSDENSLVAKYLPKSVKESTCKVVYMCRDPKDIFTSLWYFTNKVRQQKVYEDFQ
ncbi:sulfotransferase domain protein [Medicago truncatula]|nr:sulfotransferase domain protein [Medicago truncatula]